MMLPANLDSQKDIYVFNSLFVGKTSNNTLKTNLLNLEQTHFYENIITNNTYINNNVINITGNYLYLNRIFFEDQNLNLSKGIIQNILTLNYINPIDSNTLYGIQINYTNVKSQYIGWDSTLQQFVQKNYNGDYVKVDFVSDLNISFNGVQKDGDTINGHLTLQQNTNPQDLSLQITKEYVDNYIISGVGLNHDNKYVSYTGRNMEDTQDLTYEGRSKEVSIEGKLRLLKTPIQNNHQVNLSYQKEKYQIFSTHNHNDLYLLKNQSTTYPFKPIKNNYFELGKDQSNQNEFLTLRQVSNNQTYHEHDYLWNTTEFSEQGQKVGTTNKFKNVLEANLEYTEPYIQPDDVIVDSKDSVIRQYLDKIKHPNYGKLFIGYYDFMRGNSLNEGQTVAQLDLTGWYEYYKQKINNDLQESDFIVFPIITLSDFFVPNKFSQALWNGTPPEYYPYIGYHGQSKFKFGNWNYPNESEKYKININLYSQDIQYSQIDEYTLLTDTSGYFQNFRIYLIGGAIGYTFKYYTNFIDYLDTYQKV